MGCALGGLRIEKKGWEKKATVKVHVWDGFPAVKGFHRSLPEHAYAHLDPFAVMTIPVCNITTIMHRT